MKIYYDNRTDEKIVPLKKLIRLALTETLKFEGAYKDVEVSLSFVTDEEIKEINKSYRGKNKSTDVLSFPMINYMHEEFFRDLTKEELENERDLVSGKVNLGDIVVSLDTIRRQAKDFKNTFEKELTLMVIHSMLHLMGYDHVNNKKEEKRMFGKQELILERVFDKYEK